MLRWKTSVAACLVVLIAALAVFVVGRDGDSCSLQHEDQLTLSSYEWRQTTWRTPSGRQLMITNAAELCVDRLYVDLTGAATIDGEQRSLLLSDLKQLGEEADEEGIELGALAGDPWWPSEQGEIDAANFLDFVADADRLGIAIAGIHLDVEPWGLDEWHDQRENLIVSYLGFVESVEQHRANIGLTTSIAFLIPYWFDGSNGEAPQVVFSDRLAFPYEHLVSVVSPDSAVVVMAYRQRALGPGGIVDLAQEELAQPGPEVVIALETAPIEPSSASFAGLDLDTLRSEIQIVVDQTGVAEVVINDIEHLDNLNPSTE